MPEISLTDFVDFVIKAGTPKLTKVREVKNRKPYEPAFDFWKRLREGIADFHRNGGTDKSRLDDIVDTLTDRKKVNRYPAALAAYKRFLGRKKVKWFDPKRGVWSHGGLDVRVNPELGLEIDGTLYVVKLYFKDESPSKNRVDVVLAMLEDVVGTQAPKGSVMAVLDIANAKLLCPPNPEPKLMALMQGEARSFVEIWKSI